MNDPVNKPSHYQLMPGVEVYDVRHAILKKAEGVSLSEIDDWSRAWEYLTRMWGKNKLEDAKKAQWYLSRLIERMEKAEKQAECPARTLADLLKKSHDNLKATMSDKEDARHEDEEWEELGLRMNIIARNGNDGLHYCGKVQGFSKEDIDGLNHDG